MVSRLGAPSCSREPEKQVASCRVPTVWMWVTCQLLMICRIKKATNSSQ